MCRANDAYSPGLPKRAGNGVCLPIEDPRSDRCHTNLMLRELARERQRQRDDAALRSSVCRLTDLSIVRGDRCGADDHAAILAGFDGPLQHFCRYQTNHVERTD
jgi:hypothetical protein